MNTYNFTVIVDAATYDEALTVMTERFSHDEDYGFDYTIDIDWTES